MAEDLRESANFYPFSYVNSIFTHISDRQSRMYPQKVPLTCACWACCETHVQSEFVHLLLSSLCMLLQIHIWHIFVRTYPFDAR